MAYEIDCDGSIEYVSPVVTKVLGYKSSDLIGNDSFPTCSSDDRQSRDAKFRKLAKWSERDNRLSGLHSRWNNSMTAIRLWFLIDGVPKGVRGVFFDVFPIVNCGAGLKRSEQITKVIASAARDAAIYNQQSAK
ncbi:MAG: PAS domain S-box protein [bacterium]|nr:PAS domain S-box protein [bacterium]